MGLGRSVACQQSQDSVQLIQCAILDAYAAGLSVEVNLHGKSEPGRQIALKRGSLPVLRPVRFCGLWRTKAPLRESLGLAHIQAPRHDGASCRFGRWMGQQGAGVPGRERARLHMNLDPVRQLQEANRVRDVAAGFSNQIAQLVLCEAELTH